MSLKIIFFVAVNIIVLVMLIQLAMQPGGRLVPLAISCLVMSIVGIYYGFIKKSSVHGLFYLKYRAQTAAAAFLVMSIGIAYWAQQERTGIDLISQWVSPYPEINKMMMVPSISKEYIWGWLLESPDPPEKIMDFYRDEKNTQGWDVTQSERIFFLKKEGFRLMVMINPIATGSGLYYELKKID